MKKCFLATLLLGQAILTNNIPTITLTERQLCDTELLLVGGFYPLTGFLTKADYDSVVESMRFADGSLWPIPITLDISEKKADELHVGEIITLKTPEHLIIAYLTISDIWQPDKIKEAQNVYGTCDTTHPGVDYVLNRTGRFYIGGTITPAPSFDSKKLHYDFAEYRKTPAQVKQMFKEKNIDRVVAFQTRNPMHRAHYELTRRAAQQENAHLLIHPVVGMTKPGDVDYATRIRCYKHILNYYPTGSVTLNLLPLAMRMAGPREAVWHALIRKNYGCTHFIVGRDHAGPGKDKDGNTFYGPYDAQELAKQLADEIGITIVPFRNMVYVPKYDTYCPQDEITDDVEAASLSGTALRKLLQEGKEIPSWFSFHKVIQELQKAYPPREKQGVTIFLTGLSASGKSTIAKALTMKLNELQYRRITLLDGDEIRTHLTKGLGFSKHDRSLNVRRVGYVAHQITKNGGLAICSLIAPYEADRLYNKNIIADCGNYIEIHISTPLEECEKRDPKGMYAKARAGIIPQFTGINDPYEEPKKPALSIDTSKVSTQAALEQIIAYLYDQKLI